MKLVTVCHDKLHCSLTTTSKVVAGILVVLNWFFYGKVEMVLHRSILSFFAFHVLGE